MQREEKIAGYLGLARRANYLVVGQENLAGYKKKLFLVLLGTNSGEKSKQVATKVATSLNVAVVTLNEPLDVLTNIHGCQILGIKNKGMADQIQNLQTQE